MDLFDFIKNKIDSSESFQPILFLGNSKTKLDLELNTLILNLFSYYEVDKNNIYKLSDTGETIKIDEVRNFISKSNIKSNFKFQIFLIENIKRFTLQSANATLKFLEEPGNGNIVFLTNDSESGVLETILSRVVKVDIFGHEISKKNEFYYNLVRDLVLKKDFQALFYFFDDKKLQKEDYISFFNNFILFIKENLIHIELLEEIESYLNLIEKNNVSPKYLFDRLISKINFYEK